MPRNYVFTGAGQILFVEKLVILVIDSNYLGKLYAFFARAIKRTRTKKVNRKHDSKDMDNKKN